MGEKERRQSEIAPSTLLLASVGSLVATFVLARLGLGGTLAGAALAPVLMRSPAR